MVAVANEATVVVVTANVALVPPGATVTVDGTVADALSLDSETEMPPLGATLVKVTVPADELPPVTLIGLSDTDAGVTPCVAVRDKFAVEFAPIETLS